MMMKAVPWRNGGTGRRTRLKIWRSSLFVWVRPPLPPPLTVSKISPAHRRPFPPKLFPRLVTDIERRIRSFGYLEQVLTGSAVLILILTIQTACGAWQADFNKHPDESGQFVTGLLFFDYFKALPSGNPVDWGLRYYLHYPRVGLSRWPPGFAIMESLWWMLFSPSRVSTLLLEGACTWTASMIVFRLARRTAGLGLALAATALMVCSPVVSASYSSCMADAPCLLAGAALLDATVRLLAQPSFRLVLWTGFWLLFAASIKGTGLLLLPAPIFCIAMVGESRLLRSRWIVGTGCALVAVVAYISMALPATMIRFVRDVAGIGFDSPWSIQQLVSFGGYGVCVLAVLGFIATLFADRGRASHEALAASAFLLSVSSGSFFVRAMKEHRHWMILFPALVLLCLVPLCHPRIPPRVRAALGLAAICLFPFRIPVLHHYGFASFVAQVHTPGRILVAGNGDIEGPWIAAVAAAEHRPSSFVIRGTKAFASMDWNGDYYQLLVDTPTGIENRLDQFRVDTVVVGMIPGLPLPQHLQLLNSLMATSPVWRSCAKSGIFEAWCRVRAPQLKAKPLRIDLRASIGRIVTE